MLQETFKTVSRVEVDSFDGLLVDYVAGHQADVILRGLRAVSDFEYEFQMALMNRKLDPEIETFFMAPSVDYTFLSSNLVKEVSYLGGCLDGLVPESIARRLKEKFEQDPQTSLLKG